MSIARIARDAKAPHPAESYLLSKTDENGMSNGLFQALPDKRSSICIARMEWNETCI
jgi:hypothetical protein